MFSFSRVLLSGDVCAFTGDVPEAVSSTQRHCGKPPPPPWVSFVSWFVWFLTDALVPFFFVGRPFPPPPCRRKRNICSVFLDRVSVALFRIVPQFNPLPWLLPPCLPVMLRPAAVVVADHPIENFPESPSIPLSGPPLRGQPLGSSVPAFTALCRRLSPTPSTGRLFSQRPSFSDNSP